MSYADKRRAAIIEYARQYAREHDRPPTLREIADGVGMRSTSGVHYHLKTAGMLRLIRQTSKTL